MYILIITMLMTGSGSVVTTQEFSSNTTCEMAARIVRNMQAKVGHPDYDTAVCTPK